MATPDTKQFDESEEEDDFNPAPADMSDEEPEGGDHEPVSRRSPKDQEERSSPKPDNRRRSVDAAENEDDEDKNAPADVDGAADEDDDEEDEEDEDEEEEDDEDEDVQQGHRRKRRRDRRNAFLDIEAEVDDEDEPEDDERDGEEIEDFIDNDAHPDDIAESGTLNDDRRHRELDAKRDMESHMDAEEQAEILRKRYGHRRPAKGLGDTSVVPRRLLLPSVNDPSIWAVRCKEGKERDIIFSIMKRIEDRLGTKDELKITSAFERGGPTSVMKGYIYVEAFRQTDILVALDGVMNVYPHTKMILVDLKDMPDLFRVTKTPTLEPGAWVRLKRPFKHQGDLAQVLDVTENGLEARVKFIPRIEYDSQPTKLTGDGKRKRPVGAVAGIRPPQRLFSEVEARKHGYTASNEEFENGFQIKDIKIQALTATDVNPTLEEVARFTSGGEDGSENLDLKALAASLKDGNANATYLPGDVVEVYSGEQKGLVGKTLSNQGDIVSLHVTEGSLVGQTIDVPVKGLRKRFKLGDHVKVIGGSRFRDEVGLVVKISEDRVTLLTDQTNTEVTVFSKDLREADDSGGQASLGHFSLLDLVQLDATTVGCVVKVNRETLGVLDQNGDVRQVMPSQIPNLLPKRKLAVAADRTGSEIRIDDVVREYGGQRRQGKIIHIHRANLFLHTTTSNENAGVFVVKANNVNTIAAKGGRVVTSTLGPDLSAMNPAYRRNKAEDNAAGSMPPPAKIFGRDKLIGQMVIIRKGVHKGYLGRVKDTTETHARIELHTKSKFVKVPTKDLKTVDSISGREIDPYGRMGGRTGGSMGPPGGGMDSMVPDWRGGSRTPIARDDRTLAADGGRTPAWKATASGDNRGGRTPAWVDGSRTVNPYDGSRTAYGSQTPAWQSGARTPMHDPVSSGSKTPAYGSGGGSSAYGSWASGAKTPAYGGSAPTPGASGNDTWGFTPAASGSANDYDAPTPAAGLLSAPTPGALNAPTPGAYSAPTPGAMGAPTPGAWGDMAPTPAAAALTPGATGFASGYYGAPTPTPDAYGAPETPAPSGPKYTDDD